MKRALVTGASGMLGSYIVERLHAEGWTVRGVGRSPASRALIAALGAEAVAGDVTDAAAMRRAAAGCDVVFHAAAAIGPESGWEAFRLGNVAGTANVVAAAAASGSRLVHVSSTSVYGRDRYRDVPVAEDVPLPVLPARDAYGRSKQEAERVVLAARAGGRVWAAIVRPPVMYGRRDRQFVPRVARILGCGVFPLIGGGRSRTSLVHAQAVADGAVRAACTDHADGRVYHLTDDFDVTAAGLVAFAALGLGRRVRVIPLPASAAPGGRAALALALLLAGRRDLAAHAAGAIDMLTRDNPFTSARARREIGWSPTIRPEHGLPDAFRWWSEHADATRT